MSRPAKAPKPPKTRKPPKPPKAKRGREPRAEGAWVTPEGYRLVERLAALDPSRPGGDMIVSLANEVVDQHIRLGRRGLAVCAAAPGTGVTFVAANLAIALAQAGVSTLLVDANLEQPGLQALIAPPEEGPGLRQLLADPALPLMETVRHEVLPDLSVLYAGPDAGEGNEGLASDRFRELAQHCLRDYECTIFDTPPANRSPGARLVSAAAGYAIVVARRHDSFADDLATLTAQLSRDEVFVVGSVLNRA